MPSDGNSKGEDREAVVNGIKAGATVVISDETYSVEVVDDNGETATITLNEAPGALDPGTPIAEQREFTVELREVVLAENAPEGRADNNNFTVTATQDDIDEHHAIPVIQPFLVIELRDPKMRFYVRNTMGDAGNPVGAPEANSITYPEGGATYFETDLPAVEVKANPGDTLEYLVTVYAGNDGPLTVQEYQIPETADLDYVEESTVLNGVKQIDSAIEGEGGITLKHEEGEDPNVIARNETAYVTYQMKVMGGDSVPGEEQSNNDTYFGCLPFQSGAGAEGCLPDGTVWADVVEQGKEDAHTACWKGEEEGQWEVGENSADEVDWLTQDDLRATNAQLANIQGVTSKDDLPKYGFSRQYVLCKG